MMKLRPSATKVVILFLCFLFMFVVPLLFRGGGEMQVYLQCVLGFLGCINQLFLLFGARFRLEFDQHAVTYMPYSIIYLKQRSVTWAEIQRFEWKEDPYREDYVLLLVMDLKNGKSVSISVSGLDADLDEIKSQFRSFARMNNVREYYKISLQESDH